MERSIPVLNEVSGVEVITTSTRTCSEQGAY
jgi:hypothetical protein